MHQTMQGIINPVFTSRQVQLHTTLKPVTPFGGLVSLIEFKIDVASSRKSAGRSHGSHLNPYFPRSYERATKLF